MLRAISRFEMSFSIRPANPTDAITLARMRYEFRSTVGNARVSDTEFIKNCGHWMAERLDGNSTWRCWVAEKEEQLVGNIWLQFIEKIPNPTEESEIHVYVTNLFVRNSAR